MWIARQAEALVRRMARQFPAVLVTGARQSGKTSLLRRLYPKASYLSLDLPAHAEGARTAPEAWVVDVRERVLHVYRDPGPAGYRTSFTRTGEESVCALALPALVVTVAALFPE